MKLFFDKDRVPGVDQLLAGYGAREFQSPCRSTVPLLSLLKHGGPVWEDILRGLGMTDEGELHAEFTVSPARGRGKASHTDVMLREAQRSQAIEVKWTEPRYLTVDSWLARSSNGDNRREVIAGWLSTLEHHTTRVPNIKDVGQVVYQLLHRAAAACTGCTSPGVAYLQFSPLPSGAPAESSHLEADLAHLQKALRTGPSFQARLIQVDLEPTSAFNRIKDLPKGSAGTSETVRSTLLGPPLFKFVRCRVDVIKAV